VATSMPVSQTLRTVIGLDDTPPDLADATLIMVDFQNTYLSGVMELENADAAVKAGARLVNTARESGAKVVHIVNDGGEWHAL
jgi:nicotinamidase-related amidase